jgi:hypothetical protein
MGEFHWPFTRDPASLPECVRTHVYHPYPRVELTRVHFIHPSSRRPTFFIFAGHNGYVQFDQVDIAPNTFRSHCWKTKRNGDFGVGFRFARMDLQIGSSALCLAASAIALNVPNATRDMCWVSARTITVHTSAHRTREWRRSGCCTAPVPRHRFPVAGDTTS